MSDDGDANRTNGRRGRPPGGTWSPYDRRVRDALCAATWGARWAAYAASMDTWDATAGLATAWIHVQNPRRRLLGSLERHDRLLCRPFDWYLVGDWPAVGSPTVLKHSCTTAVGIISNALEGEAEFIASIIAPD